jgi:hypothetical protein
MKTSPSSLFGRRLVGQTTPVIVALLLGFSVFSGWTQPATVVRGPYLQSGTSSNIVVRWRTDRATDSRVAFGAAPTNLTFLADEANPTTEHSVTLPDLSANTKYFYAFGSSRDSLTGGADYHFTTAPAGGKRTRIWAIGDSGTASLGSTAPMIVRDAYQNFSGTTPTDVWLMLGDNAYFSGTDAEYQTAVFEVYQDFLRTTPVWPTIGNHETFAPDGSGNIAYTDIFSLPTDGRAGGVPSGTERYYSFDYGDIHFVCLDSELSANTSGSSMLNWLEQDLSANTRQWLVAFWHSPPYTQGSHNSDFEGNLIAMRQNVVPVLESHGVDLILCGHSHSYERSYLLNGHYGNSATLQPAMVLDGGNGRPAGTGAYSKGAEAGAVYIVAGSSGQTSGGTLNHPAMFLSLNRLGSVVIDVETNRLDAIFLRENGQVDDSFTIIKGTLPPTIITDPGSRTVTVGSTVSFSVVAGGTKPLAYQWLFDGVAIPAASNSTLILAGVQLSQAGNYAVVVTNAGGSVTSAVAVLVVNPAPLCLPAPGGLVGWWPLDGDGTELINGHTAAVLGNPIFAPASVDQGMFLDGVDDQGDVSAHPFLNVGLGGGFTIELWIKPAALGQPQPLLEWNNRQGVVGVQFWISTGSGAGSLFAALIDQSGAAYHLSSAAGILRTDAWQHVALSYDKTSGMARLYLNGSVVAQANIGSRPLQTSYDLFFGRRVAVSGTNYRYTGGMDEMCLFDRALTGIEIQAIVDAGTGGKCKVAQPPHIVVQPQSRNVVVGEAVSFSAAAAGSGPLSYQWRLNGADIANATQSSLTLTNVQLSDGGNYSIVVTNVGGSVTSAVAMLFVSPAPLCLPVSGGLVGWWPLDGDGTELVNGHTGVVLGNPTFAMAKVDRGMFLDGVNDQADVAANTVVDVGLGTGFTIELWIKPDTLGEPQPLLEWNNRQGVVGLQFWISTGSGAGSLFAGLIDRTGAAYLLPTAAGILRTNGWQHVALSYEKTSGMARLYLDGAVVAQAFIGARAMQTSYDLFFGRRVAVSGTNYRYTGGMDEVSLYDRALSAAEIQAVVDAGSTGKCKTAQLPRIVAQPLSRAVVLGETMNFSVTATGNGPLSYQWRFNGADITNAIQTSLTLSNVQLSQAGGYSVVVANAGGSVTSAVAVLVVNLPPPILRIANASASGGGLVNVPVELLAQGNENALGFSLNFDTSLLAFTSVTLSPGAPAGATLIVNSNQAASGRLGLGLALAAGNSFPAGTQAVVGVRFSVAVLASSATTSITFGDSPTARQVSDQHAAGLAAVYVTGTVNISAVDYEGDVAPRPGGDRALTITDWVQSGRFVAALDTVSGPGEFQRADCAPRDTLGNGTISLTDYVQAGRYAVGLDPATPAGGPTSGGMFAGEGGFHPASANRSLCIVNTSIAQGQKNQLPIALEASGDENALSFSVVFDPLKLQYAGVTNGSGTAGASLTVNASQSSTGHVGIVLALPPGITLPAGTQEVAKVQFVALAPAPSTNTISFGDIPVARETSDPLARALTTAYNSGTVSVTPQPGQPLRVTRSGNSILITWPSSAIGYELEGTTGTLGTTWVPVPGVIDLVEQKLVIVTISGSQRFFRLRKL